MTSALRISGLTVRGRHGRRLLDDITLELDAGEQVLIVGASGSGKSTLLRLIAGLSLPGCQIEGSIRVLGEEVLGRDAAAEPLPVGWLPQDPAAAVCLPRVGDDVAFGCESRGYDLQRIDRDVASALRLVGAADWRDRDTGTLSAGQAQRVGLAAGVAPGPELLLLDEPTSMLDPVALRRVRDALAGLADERHAPAALLVEHRLDEWADGADLPGRLVVLEHGRVLADGEAERVWKRYGAALLAVGCHLPWPVERALLDAAQAEPGRRPPVAASDPAGGLAPLLVADGLDVGHRHQAVLRGASVQVRPGEVVALLGANGAGKTTLLHTLAGILPALAGRVRCAGGRPALIFQAPGMQFLASTVAAELAFDGAAPDRVSRMLRRLRLESMADASVHRLSGGEQRRLSVGSVLLGGRRVLLADEPTFGLDRDGVQWTTAALRAAAAEGRAVLLSSHDLRFVLEVSDRAYVVASGTLGGGGPTPAVLSDPLLGAVGLLPPAAVREALEVTR